MTGTVSAIQEHPRPPTSAPSRVGHHLRPGAARMHRVSKGAISFTLAYFAYCAHVLHNFAFICKGPGDILSRLLHIFA